MNSPSTTTTDNRFSGIRYYIHKNGYFEGNRNIKWVIVDFNEANPVSLCFIYENGVCLYIPTILPIHLIKNIVNNGDWVKVTEDHVKQIVF